MKALAALCMLTMVCGCKGTSSLQPAPVVSQELHMEVLKAEEHFGHNFDELGRHTVWCDGCRARLIPSGHPLVIYWINNAIKDTPFRFKQGQKYRVLFTGEVASGVMGYQGQCIALDQLQKLEAE